MNNLVEQDQDRLKLLKKYGYDIPKIRNRIIVKAGLSFDGNMLEVGTGRGHMAGALARKGFKFVSIDLDKKGQEVAKTHLKALKGRKSVSFKIMNAEKLRYKNSSFNYVISVDFIHHAKHPVKCLKEMIRVVRNTLIIADIKNYYKKEDLIGREVILVDNLDPAVIRGVESNGMLLAASDDKGISIINPDREVALGSLVK